MQRRAAVLACRRVMRTEGDDWRRRVAALDAYLVVRPEDGPDKAERQVTRAICSAAAHHGAWFWRGVRWRPQGPRARPPTPKGAAPRGRFTPRPV